MIAKTNWLIKKRNFFYWLNIHRYCPIHILGNLKNVKIRSPIALYPDNNITAEGIYLIIPRPGDFHERKAFLRRVGTTNKSITR